MLADKFIFFEFFFIRFQIVEVFIYYKFSVDYYYYYYHDRARREPATATGILALRATTGGHELAGRRLIARNDIIYTVIIIIMRRYLPTGFALYNKRRRTYIA